MPHCDGGSRLLLAASRGTRRRSLMLKIDLNRILTKMTVGRKQKNRQKTLKRNELVSECSDYKRMREIACTQSEKACPVYYYAACSGIRFYEWNSSLARANRDPIRAVQAVLAVLSSIKRNIHNAIGSKKTERRRWMVHSNKTSLQKGCFLIKTQKRAAKT